MDTTSSSNQPLLAWPSRRDLRRCGLVSFGGHSCAGGNIHSTGTPRGISFAEGGAFDFPIEAMRDEYAMLELADRSTRPARPPGGPASAFLSGCSNLLMRLSPTRAAAAPRRAPPAARPCLHSLASAAPHVAGLHQAACRGTSDSLPDSPAFCSASSLRSIRADSDCQLEDLMHSALLRANASVPFGRTVDPASLQGILTSDTGEVHEDGPPSVPSGGALHGSDAPARPAGGLRGIVRYAWSFQQRLSSFGRPSGARRVSGGARRVTADWLRSPSISRGSTSMQRGLWPFSWPSKVASDAGGP